MATISGVGRTQHRDVGSDGVNARVRLLLPGQGRGIWLLLWADGRQRVTGEWGRGVGGV